MPGVYTQRLWKTPIFTSLDRVYFKVSECISSVVGKKTDIEDQIRKSRKMNNARSLDFLLEKSSEFSHEQAVKFCDLHSQTLQKQGS